MGWGVGGRALWSRSPKSNMDFGRSGTREADQRLHREKCEKQEVRPQWTGPAMRAVQGGREE